MFEEEKLLQLLVTRRILLKEVQKESASASLTVR